MKFDYIVGNPPYQIPIGDQGKTKSIWAEITIKVIALLKEGGEMTIIHPGTWRFITPNSKKSLVSLKKLYSENNLVKLVINNRSQGKLVFGVRTDFDVVRLIKEHSAKETCIVTPMGTHKVDINEYNIIPSDNFILYNKIKANKDDIKVELLYSRSAYSSGSKNINTNKCDLFKYPILYTMTKRNGIKLIYSNTCLNGHFGIPKLIVKRGVAPTLLDINGDYGMAEFAAGIVDTPLNLLKIQKVIESAEFRLFQTNITGSLFFDAPIDGLGVMFKFIREFRKDFWKEFYTMEMEQELINEGKLDKYKELI